MLFPPEKPHTHSRMNVLNYVLQAWQSLGAAGSSLGDVISYATPADTLAFDNSLARLRLFGKLANNANNKRLVLGFGGTTLLDRTVTTANVVWELELVIFRLSATTGIAKVRYQVGTTIVDFFSQTFTENFATALTLTVALASTNPNEITVDGGNLIIEPTAA